MTEAPPQNLEAEDSVLGAMMLSPKTVDLVIEIVKPEDFYRESNGVLFKTICQMNDEGIPADPALVIAELAKKKILATVGGELRVKELAHLIPTAANAAHYAKLVKESKTRRLLIDAGGRIAQLGWEGGDLDEAKAKSEEMLSNATAENIEVEFVNLAGQMPELVDEIRQAYLTKTPLTGLSMGFPGLDKLTTGLHPGQLVVIAARPGIGKSVLTQNICENVAEAGGSAAIFSLEMQRREMQLRSLARQGGIALDRLRTGMLSEEDLPKMKPAIEKIAGWMLYIEDDATISPAELRARARRLKRTHGLDILAVDYLQLMSNGKGAENRAQEIAEITRSLKMLARQLEIPVIAVSQLNRQLESRVNNKRPILADLRESGAIEQDADLIVFIYRDDAYDPDSKDKGVAELIVAKNRMGTVDTVKMSFVGRHQTFKPMGGVASA